MSEPFVEDLEFFLNKNIDRDQKLVWDEWSFYSNSEVLGKTVEKLKEKILICIDDINTIDYFVGLSKSGIPLASLMGFMLKRPIVPFSIGEFFSPTGESVIGFPDYDESLFSLKNKKILLFDSHVVSGETHRLFMKLVDGLKIEAELFCVIADCRSISDPYQVDNFVSIFDKETVDKFLENIPNRHKGTFFWKHHRNHWLIPAQQEQGVPVPEVVESPNNILVLNNSLSEQAKQKLIITEDGTSFFVPLLLYIDNSFFSEVCDEIILLLKKHNISTLISCSLAAIPIGICLAHKLQGEDIKFVFLGNGDDIYYKDKFNGSRGVFFCDDVLATGALIYKAVDKFFNIPNFNIFIFVLLYQSKFQFKNYLSSLPDSASIYTLIKDV